MGFFKGFYFSYLVILQCAPANAGAHWDPRRTCKPGSSSEQISLLRPSRLRGKGSFAPLLLLSPKKYFVFFRGPLARQNPYILQCAPANAGAHWDPRRTCKPGSVWRGHLSRPTVTDRLERYSRISPGGQPYVERSQTCIGRGLHGTGRYRPVGELLPRLSTLSAPAHKDGAVVYFCCTFLEVAFT